jgi:hypothetical protein
MVMRSPVALLERGIPDLVSTDGLPESFAAEIDFLAGRTRNPDTEASWRSPGVRARALVARGDLDGGHEILGSVDIDALDLQGLVAAAWAVSRAGPADLVAPIRSLIAARPDSFLFADTLPLGPRAATLGMLDAVDGRLDEAIELLTEAITVGDARAPLWGALARLEHARVLHCAAVTGPLACAVYPEAASVAVRTLTAARTFFMAGGYRSLLARVDEISDFSTGQETLRPVIGCLLPGSRWTVGLGLEPAGAFRPSKGLVALRHLIANRDRVVSAAELDAVVKGTESGFLADLSRQGEIDESEWADGSALPATLREVFFDDTVRSRVTKLLRRTIVKLGGTHRLLGAHLDRAVRTGHACRYEPDAVVGVNWRL